MPPSTLYRLAGRAGIVTGFLLLFNDARRIGLVPENTVTHSIAPLAPFLAPFALIGIYLWQREQTGRLGLWGFALNLVGLVGSAAIEFSLHYIVPLLDKGTVEALVDARTGTGFLIVSVLFIAGTILFGLATWRGGRFPRWTSVLYVVGFVPTALRTVAPAPVVSIGFVLGSVALIWLSAELATKRGSVLNRPGGHREHGTTANSTPPEPTPASTPQ
jgi:hypothetical protein